MKLKNIKFFNSSYFQVIGIVLVISVGLYINYIYGYIGVIPVTIGFVFLAVISLASVYLYSSYSNSKIEENFIEKIDLLKDFIAANGLGSIINDKTLSVWESQANSIWVVSNDISNDVCHEGYIFKSVQGNIERGVKYTYFVPDTYEIRGRLHFYCSDIHKGSFSNDQINVCLIPSEGFHFVSEIVMYDVNINATTKSVQMFPNNLSNYYIELDNTHQQRIIGVLKHLKKVYGVNDIKELVSEV